MGFIYMITDTFPYFCKLSGHLQFGRATSCQTYSGLKPLFCDIMETTWSRHTNPLCSYLMWFLLTLIIFSKRFLFIYLDVYKFLPVSICAPCACSVLRDQKRAAGWEPNPSSLLEQYIFLTPEPTL